MYNSLILPHIIYCILTFDSLTGSWSVWPHVNVVIPPWLIKIIDIKIIVEKNRLT